MTAEKHKKLIPVIRQVVANVSRWILSAVFIFSGFIKANDPRGTEFKLRDYVTAFGIPDIPEFSLAVVAVILAAVEFSLGIHILFGMSRRRVARFTLVVVLLLTLFTVYIAIFDPVSDCGCFGDFIVLTNGQTLLKNIVLLVLAVLNLRYCKDYIKLVGQNTRWIITTFSSVYILVYSLTCILELPLIDYRPYKVGTDLRKSFDDAPKFDVRIVYEKDGKRISLAADDPDPDSTWTYIETQSLPMASADNISAANFYVTDPTTGDDITEDIVFADGYTFLLVIPDLQKANEAFVDLVNESYDYAKDNGYPYYCLTGSETAYAQFYWREHTGAEYEFYNSDERELKTIVRGNPGLVLLKDGVIISKWSSYNFPDEYDLTGRLEEIPLGELQTEELHTKFLRLLLYFFGPLLAFVLVDRIGSGFAFYRNIKRKSKKIQHIV